MVVGILGSGAVGVALAKGFLAEGHTVHIATRDLSGSKVQELQAELDGAVIEDFAAAASAAELAVLCVNASGLENAVQLAGADNLASKIVIDTTNVITQEGDMLVYGGKEQSAAEQVQTWLPESKVVKAFNTVGHAMMYKPDFGSSSPTMFIAGNDEESKKQVAQIVTAFGWEPLDTGGLLAARSLEPMALIWINNSIKSGTPHHAFKML